MHQNGDMTMRLLSMASEILPLTAFFLGNHFGDIFIGAGAGVSSAALVILITRWREKRWANFALFSVLIQAVFTLTALMASDSLFIKIQPSLFNVCFGLALIAGRLRGIAVMKVFFGSQFSLTEQTWLTLSLRWGLFFLFLAGLNEWAWRSLTDDGWVHFKTFVAAPLSLGFMLAQLPITLRGTIKPE